MNTTMRGRLRRALIVVGGAGAAAAILASVYTTPVCACTTVAERVLRSSSLEMEADFLQQAAETSVPLGTAEAALIKSLGIPVYAKYCLQGGGGRALMCLLPHDANFWRDRHVELVFAFDRARRVKTLGARPLVRYFP